MHLLTSSILIVVSFTASIQAITLFEGLIAANASRFANFIQADPNLVALFTSPDVKTVFAPSDDAVKGFSETDFRRSLHLYARQATNRRARQQTCQQVTNVAQLRAPEGAVISSNLETEGGGQSPIVAKEASPPPAGNGTTKRQELRGPVQLFSGLGNNVTIVKGDTPYDGGLIHTIDG